LLGSSFVVSSHLPEGTFWIGVAMAESSSSSKRAFPDASYPDPSKTRREAAECAVCYDTVDIPVERLPCDCKVSYCMPCWDKSLATSFRNDGTARCPTCRSLVRVDVEEGTSGQQPSRLVFSLETRDAEAFSEQSELMRLIEQARPIQLGLLHKFRDAEPQPDAPQCVCGDKLERTTVAKRRDSSCHNSIICDLCDRHLSSGEVWTCPCGHDTVLHFASYDVCGRCFDSHALGLSSSSDEEFTPATTISYEIGGVQLGDHNDATGSEEEQMGPQDVDVNESESFSSEESLFSSETEAVEAAEQVC